jgi:hypothetical protein
MALGSTQGESRSSSGDPFADFKSIDPEKHKHIHGFSYRAYKNFADAVEWYGSNETDTLNMHPVYFDYQVDGKNFRGGRDWDFKVYTNYGDKVSGMKECSAFEAEPEAPVGRRTKLVGANIIGDTEWTLRGFGDEDGWYSDLALSFVTSLDGAGAPEPSARELGMLPGPVNRTDTTQRVITGIPAARIYDNKRKHVFVGNSEDHPLEFTPDSLRNRIDSVEEQKLQDEQVRIAEVLNIMACKHHRCASLSATSAATHRVLEEFLDTIPVFTDPLRLGNQYARTDDGRLIFDPDGLPRTVFDYPQHDTGISRHDLRTSFESQAASARDFRLMLITLVATVAPFGFAFIEGSTSGKIELVRNLTRLGQGATDFNDGYSEGTCGPLTRVSRRDPVVLDKRRIDDSDHGTERLIDTENHYEFQNDNVINKHGVKIDKVFDLRTRNKWAGSAPSTPSHSTRGSDRLNQRRASTPILYEAALPLHLQLVECNFIYARQRGITRRWYKFQHTFDITHRDIVRFFDEDTFTGNMIGNTPRFNPNFVHYVIDDEVSWKYQHQPDDHDPAVP